MVAMLSDRSEYSGGISCFESASGEPRQLSLDCGDVVMFRAKTEHWITDVTSGEGYFTN